MSNQNKGEKTGSSQMGLGIAIGLMLGAALKNIGAGLALGVAIGAALDAAQKRHKDTGT